MLCLYYNSKNGSSYIDRNCNIKSDIASHLIFKNKFYVIEDKYKIVPQGMSIYEIYQRELGITHIEQIYDPFQSKLQPTSLSNKALLDAEKGEFEKIRFMAWSDPAPNTIPLYLFSNGENVYISISQYTPNPNYEELFFSPIFVMNDNITTFSNIQGRCIPDYKAKTTFEECIKSYKKTNLPFSLLTHIKNSKNNKLSIKNIILLFLFSIIIILLFLS